MNDELCLREFENSNPISTDGFSLIIGEFFEIEETGLLNERFNSKMKILIRKSQKDRIDHSIVSSVFKTAREIITFYDNIFKTEKLPFKYLTHIFLPTTKCFDFTSNIVYFESLVLKNEVSNPLDMNYFYSIIANQMYLFIQLVLICG